MKPQQSIGFLCWPISCAFLFRFLVCTICLQVAAAWSSSSAQHRHLVPLYAERSSVERQSHPNRLLKKSETPQWDDLGWAWGKRSGGAIIHDDVDSSLMGQLPANHLMKRSKTADWDDLGWTWGKRSAAGGQNRLLKKSKTAEWDDLGWTWGKRSGGAVVQGDIGKSVVGQSKGAGSVLIHDNFEPSNRAQGMLPDLGWPWGKRSAEAVRQAIPSSRSIGSRNGLSATQLRALQSMVKKENPEWHDLGWAWGRRR